MDRLHGQVRLFSLVLELLLDRVHDALMLAVCQGQPLTSTTRRSGGRRAQRDLANAQRAHMHDVLVVVQGVEDAVVRYGKPDSVEPLHAEHMLARCVATLLVEVLATAAAGDATLRPHIERLVRDHPKPILTPRRDVLARPGCDDVPNLGGLRDLLGTQLAERRERGDARLLGHADLAVDPGSTAVLVCASLVFPAPTRHAWAPEPSHLQSATANRAQMVVRPTATYRRCILQLRACQS